MSRGACTFRQRDVTAAVKAALAAGLFVAGVEIENGKIRIITGKPGERHIDGATDLKGAIDQWQP